MNANPQAALAADLASRMNPEDQQKLAALLSVPRQDWWNDAEMRKQAFDTLGPEKFAKVAQELATQQEFQKVAADYYAAGQVMAHGFQEEQAKLANDTVFDLLAEKVAEKVITKLAALTAQAAPQEVPAEKKALLQKVVSA